MMRNRLAVSVLTVALATSGYVIAQPFASPAQAYGQDRAWDSPPQEFRDIQRQGFHDGIEGARKDYENHREPNVENRDEFRHPSVPHRDREAYRHGFKRGYQVGVEHLMRGYPHSY